MNGGRRPPRPGEGRPRKWPEGDRTRVDCLLSQKELVAAIALLLAWGKTEEAIELIEKLKTKEKGE